MKRSKNYFFSFFFAFFFLYARKQEKFKPDIFRVLFMLWRCFACIIFKHIFTRRFIISKFVMSLQLMKFEKFSTIITRENKCACTIAEQPNFYVFFRQKKILFEKKKLNQFWQLSSFLVIRKFSENKLIFYFWKF